MILLFAVLLCVSVGAETYSGTCGADGDNLTWELDTETGELVISGEGKMADYTSSSNAPWRSYHTFFKKVTIENGVTSVGDYAFWGCPNLPEISIPNSVTSIGAHAFHGCSSLTQITIPGSVTSIGRYAFPGCSSLTEITIPDSVTSIGDFAFQKCSSLTEITIPNSVTSIGYNPFVDCSGLASITVDEKNIVYHSTGNCIIETATKMLVVSCENSVIPSDGSVTSIGSYAFQHCSSLVEITIPDSVTSIYNSAFWYCPNLTEITIPDSVTSIGNFRSLAVRALKRLPFFHQP